jgi:hypothetical protein
VTAIIYTVPGATSTAFVPVPAATTAKMAYKQNVVGQPGTQGIPAGPAEISGTINGAPVRSGYSGGMSMMPGVWYPQLYYSDRLWINGADVSIYSDNQMPIPAADPRGKAAVLARPPTFLGQGQVVQPKGLPRWANWLSQSSSGVAGASGFGG